MIAEILLGDTMRFHYILSASMLSLGLAAGPSFAQETVISSELVGPQQAIREIGEARSIKAPKGYRAAWDDMRLNPLSGVGTRAGKAQMNLVWSTTVPRFLIDPQTGKRIR